MAKPSNILLTGTPGCGKTTVIHRAIKLLRDLRLVGFYTQELRSQGRRVGFEAIGLGGSRAALAHVESNSPKRVGRYGFELAQFEDLIESELPTSQEAVDLLIVDEIGKMECFSELFCRRMSSILDGPIPVLGTVAARGSGFIGKVRRRPDVELLTVTPENRDSLPEVLAERLNGLCRRTAR